MRLDIQKVEFKNFFSFGNKVQEWKMTPGLHLITGFNTATNSRNGCGKSSLGSSITFSLFGKTEKNLTNAEIINWKNRKACETAIEFLRGDEHFRIERGLKPNYLKLYHNGKEVPHPSNKTSFQDEIENDILGFDYLSFTSLMQCNPNNALSILKSSKGAKRKFIEQLFGLEFFTQFSDQCREKISECNISISTLKSENSSKLENIRSQKSLIESLLEFINSSKEDEVLLDRVNSRLDVYNQLDLNVDLSIALIEESKLVIKQTKISNKFIQLESEKKLLQKSVSNITNFNESLYLDYKKHISAKQDFESNVERVSNKLIEMNEFLESEKSKEKEIATSLSVQAHKIKDQQSKMKSLLSDEECPTCGAKIDTSMFNNEKSILESFENEFKELAEKKRLQSGKIDSIEFDVKDLKNEISEYKLSLDNIQKTESKLIVMEKDKELQQEKQNNEKKIVQIEKYLNILDKVQKNIFIKVREVKEHIQKLKKDEETLKTLLASKEELEKRIADSKENQRKTEEKIENAKSDIASLEKSIEDNMKSINEQEKMKQYFEHLREKCKDENVKQYAISSFIPFLNQRVNHYLSEAHQPFYLKLDAWLDLEIKGPGISENSSYGSFSGGESKIVDMAMQMAFLDIAKIQSKTFPNVLCLDELLDTSVDSVNLQKLLSIIKSKQKEDNLCVYIISHRSEIGAFEANSVLKVIKENGYSRLERE